MMAYKNTQDRESINMDQSEGTKSGEDADAAKSDTAFDPDQTRPETERQHAGEELDVSGANQGISKPMGDEKSVKKSGAGRETEKSGKASGGGSPPHKSKHEGDESNGST
jgi:hypothetical protein